MVFSFPCRLEQKAEYLDRIWDNFYGYIGSILTTTRNNSKAILLQCQLQRMSLSYSLDE